jgi:hypothetical protein
MVFLSCGLRTGVCICCIVPFCFFQALQAMCTVFAVAFRVMSLDPGFNTGSCCVILSLIIAALMSTRLVFPDSPGMLDAAGLQHVLSGGPCLRAAHSGGTVLSPFVVAASLFACHSSGKLVYGCGGSGQSMEGHVCFWFS